MGCVSQTVLSHLMSGDFGGSVRPPSHLSLGAGAWKSDRKVPLSRDLTASGSTALNKIPREICPSRRAESATHLLLRRWPAFGLERGRLRSLIWQKTTAL